MNYLFSVEMSLTLAAATVAMAAQAEGVRIDRVKAEGSGCSKETISYQVNGEGDFEVAFQEMNVLAQTEGATDARTCNLKVVAIPPQGKRLVIGGSHTEMASRMQEQGTGRVDQSYGLEGQAGSISGRLDLPRQGTGPDLVSDAFWSGLGGEEAPDRATIPDEWGGECGKPTTIVGSLTVSASAGEGGAAEIYLDRNSTRLKWAWALKPCEDNPPPSSGSPMVGKWQFQYLAANGRTVSGTMRLSEREGTYRVSSANWQGAFRDLSGSGSEMTATWQAPGGSGWVRFLVADDGNSFDGSWGFPGNSEAKGFWRGTRLPSP